MTRDHQAAPQKWHSAGRWAMSSTRTTCGGEKVSLPPAELPPSSPGGVLGACRSPLQSSPPPLRAEY